MSTDQAPGSMMPLRIVSVGDAAEGIKSFALARQDGGDLPEFTAGSHVSVQVPNGALRKYSLCNAPHERDKYVIVVKRDQDGRGGSISMLDDAREGDILPTSAPKNAFPLIESAPAHVFIAGGIGITPIISMIRSFGGLPQVPWKLYYLTRSPAMTAFLQELNDPEYRPHVKIHHDHGDPAQGLDLWSVLETPSAAHVYCCGPRGLMEAVRDMTGHWPHSNIHFESFVEGGQTSADDQPFTVTLARSGRSFLVPAGKSILETLREGGCNVVSSCESGTCGTCRTVLLEGEAIHRDMVLLPEERASQIMICVSRARSAELILDR